jgi:acyl carrier protein
MGTAPALSFDEFRRFLSNTLGIAEAALMPDANFMNDLAIESLKMVELLLQFEHQLGIKIPTDIAWEIETVGDAYNYYMKQIALSSV